MSIAVLKSEATKLVRGDSVAWTKYLPCFSPTDGWVLTYYFRGPEALDKVAVASGDKYLIELTSDNTKSLRAGDYAWSAKVSNGLQVCTIGEGQITVLENIALQTAGYDPRPYVKKVLDAIENLIAGKVTKDASSYSIQGRSLTRYSFEELETLRDKYKHRWNLHLKKEQRKLGKGSNRKIKVRFNT